VPWSAVSHAAPSDRAFDSVDANAGWSIRRFIAGRTGAAFGPPRGQPGCAPGHEIGSEYNSCTHYGLRSRESPGPAARRRSGRFSARRHRDCRQPGRLPPQEATGAVAQRGSAPVLGRHVLNALLTCGETGRRQTNHGESSAQDTKPIRLALAREGSLEDTACRRASGQSSHHRHLGGVGRALNGNPQVTLPCEISRFLKLPARFGLPSNAGLRQVYHRTAPRKMTIMERQFRGCFSRALHPLLMAMDPLEQ
jgi:hypothetical protein